LEKRTAAVEGWVLFSWGVADSNSHRFFVTTAHFARALLRKSFARLYINQGGYSNRVRPACARNKIRTIIHNTY
jgi:hypothetical protein